MWNYGLGSARAPAKTIAATSLAVALVLGLLVGGALLLGSTSARGTMDAGSASSAPGASTSASTPTPAATLTLTSPGATPAAVSLSWTETDDLFFSEYEVQDSSNSSTGPFATVGVVTDQDTTTYALGDLSPGATYWWQVIMVATLGGDSDSNVLAVTQPTTAYLWNSTTPSTSVTLNWTNNATYGGLVGFESYSIWESVSGGAYGVAATVSDAETLSDTLTGLSAGTSYSFYLGTTDCINCTSGTPSTSVTDSNTITVGTVLTLGATVTASRTSADVGQPVLLTCTPSGGESPFTYAWSLNSSSFVAGPDTISRTYNGSGSYAETCRITDHLGTQAESATSITVYADVLASLSASPAATDAGQSVVLNCTVTGGEPTISAALYSGTGVSSTGTPILDGYFAAGLAYPAGTYVATCVMTDGNGYSSASSVTLSIDPDMTVSVRSNATAAEPGYSIEFTASAVNGSGTYDAYHWNFGDGTTGTGASVAHAFSRAGDFTVTVVVTDSYGVNATESTSVDIEPLAVVALQAPTQATAGSSVELSVVASGGAGGPYNYTWNFGDGTVGYGASVNHTYAHSGTFDPTVTVRDSLGESVTHALPAVAVAAAPAAPFWPILIAILIVAAVVGLMVGLLMHRRAREASDADMTGISRWVPPVGPKGAVEGMKKCPKCGAANPSTRHSCQNCGARLGRG